MTIYLDDRHDFQNDLDAGSILVHEMVHYLQQHWHASSQPKVAVSTTCPTNFVAERKAYQAQREFLMRFGVFEPTGDVLLRMPVAGALVLGHKPGFNLISESFHRLACVPELAFTFPVVLLGPDCLGQSTGAPFRLP